MISSRLGVRPSAMIAETAAPALTVSPKTAARLSTPSATGRSARVISVITPRVPSLPTNSRVRS
jgi:hypothetical protein